MVESVRRATELRERRRAAATEGLDPAARLSELTGGATSPDARVVSDPENADAYLVIDDDKKLAFILYTGVPEMPEGDFEEVPYDEAVAAAEKRSESAAKREAVDNSAHTDVSLLTPGTVVRLSADPDEDLPAQPAVVDGYDPDYDMVVVTIPRSHREEWDRDGLREVHPDDLKVVSTRVGEDETDVCPYCGNKMAPDEGASGMDGDIGSLVCTKCGREYHYERGVTSTDLEELAGTSESAAKSEAVGDDIEWYDGDEFLARGRFPLPKGSNLDADDFVRHDCEYGSGGEFMLKRGTACPNRRFGCDFVAESAAKNESVDAGGVDE